MSLGAYRLGATGGDKRQVAELTIAPGSPLLGRTVTDATSRSGSQVVAHFPANGTERFLLDVNGEAVLGGGDRLIVTGEPQALAPLLAQTGDEATPGLLWAGWLRRMGRVAWRTLVEMDWAVQVSLAVLLSVVFLSTLVFRLGVEKYDSTANAFYRTISLLATGADVRWLEITMTVLLVMVAVYTILGGMLSVLVTDFLQFVPVLPGMISPRGYEYVDVSTFVQTPVDVAGPQLFGPMNFGTVGLVASP